MYSLLYCPSTRFLMEYINVRKLEKPLDFDKLALPHDGTSYHQPSQERNSTECGVFVCALGWFLSYNQNLSYSLADTPDFRVRMLRMLTKTNTAEAPPPPLLLSNGDENQQPASKKQRIT